MEKYLFTDGISGVKEVASGRELEELIRSAPRPELIRIWVYPASSWLSYAEFRRQRKSDKPVSIPTPVAKPRSGIPWRKALVPILLLLALLVVYNFTRVQWTRVAALQMDAARPANAPYLDTDSIINFIESVRGQKLDKMTRNNLRLRNDWPSQFLLKLDASRDSSTAGIRFHNIRITVDNATEYLVDEAIVRLSVYRDHQKILSDTFHFNQVGYAAPVVRTVDTLYKGDSVAVAFQSIRARSFNFFYTIDKQSNYGNLADRWFYK